MGFHPWWWLAAAALVFLFLWGWRELGIRAAMERTASSDAEIRLVGQSNHTLSNQLSRLGNELSDITAVLPVSGLTKGSARVLIDAQNHGVLSVSGAPKGAYELRSDAGEKILNVDVPATGQKMMFLDHLPASSKSFALAPR